LEGQTCTDPGERYVYLHEARAVAERAGDAETAVQAIDILAQDFAADGLTLKAEVLERLAPSVSEAALRGVVRTALAVVHEATRQDRFAIAEGILKAATAAADRLGVAAVSAQVAKQGNELELTRSQFDRVKPSFEKLDDASNDPQANLVVGRYRCFV